MTYKEIQMFMKNKHNITVKTCWIADVKEKMGLKVKKANNRISEDKRVYPCPEKYEELLKSAITELSN